MRADAWAALAAWVTAATALVTVFVAGWFANKQVKAALGQIDAAREAQRKQDQQAQVALATQARLAQETLEHEAREAQKNRDEQAQPNVVMFAEPNHTFWQELELVVKNFGTTPAYDVRMSFDPKPQVSPNPGDPAEGITDLAYPEVIPILAPQQEWRTSWDYATERFDVEGLATRHEGKVTYKDRQGNIYTTDSILDWDTLKGAMKIETKNIHHVAKLLEKQNEALKAIAQSLGRFGNEGSGVWVYSADAGAESQRRSDEAAERQRRRQDRDRRLRPHAYPATSEASATPPTSDQTAAQPSPEAPEAPAAESAAPERE